MVRRAVSCAVGSNLRRCGKTPLVLLVENLGTKFILNVFLFMEMVNNKPNVLLLLVRKAIFPKTCIDSQIIVSRVLLQFN